MLDIRFIRDNTDLVKEVCKNKNLKLDIDKLLTLDEKRKQMLFSIEEIRSKRNVLNDQMKSKRDDDLIKQSKELKESLTSLETSFNEIESEFNEIYWRVPNIVSKETPVSTNPDDNVIIKTVGNIPKFNFDIKDHIELGKSLDIIDFEKGTKVHGFRGYYLKNEGAQLHIALMMYAFQKVIKYGFSPMITPNLVKEFALFGSGYFPYLKDEVYKIQDKTPDNKEGNLYLAGTSELSLLAYFSDEVIEKKNLPLKVCAFSPCFRSEAGSYGKDTKGLYRIHEFLKIEQVVICENDIDISQKYFKEMSSMVEEILKELKLPYQIKTLCTADMGAGKFYADDFETYMPSRSDYGETHSCSNLTDWQTRRFNIKFKDESGNKNYCYALNNTVIASPRILIAILENYQQKDGSVKIPKVLQKYFAKNIKSIKPKKK